MRPAGLRPNAGLKKGQKQIENRYIICGHTMAIVRQLLFIRVAIYSQIRLSMQNILILIITYYWITTVIIKITDQNIVLWE